MNFFLSQLLAVVRRAQRMAMALIIMVGATQAVLAASGFTPQMRLGYRAGDQWEPAMAADTHGHIYVLYPQYGPVADCRMCTAPIMALVVSEDNGISWHSSRPMLPFPTGQFDPQIVVDPVDHQTVYASWLQNDKRDIVVARSLDFGRTWSFRGRNAGRKTPTSRRLRCTALMFTWASITKKNFLWRLPTMRARRSAAWW